MSYKVQRPCRVCGNMFTPCADCERDKTAFHWRKITCSFSCGMEYFRRVEEARRPKEEVIVQEEVDAMFGVDLELLEAVPTELLYERTVEIENKEESEQIE